MNVYQTLVTCGPLAPIHRGVISAYVCPDSKEMVLILVLVRCCIMPAWSVKESINSYATMVTHTHTHVHARMLAHTYTHTCTRMHAAHKLANL